jgi:hypothetical protein
MTGIFVVASFHMRVTRAASKKAWMPKSVLIPAACEIQFQVNSFVDFQSPTCKVGHKFCKPGNRAAKNGHKKSQPLGWEWKRVTRF